MKLRIARKVAKASMRAGYRLVHRRRTALAARKRLRLAAGPEPTFRAFPAQLALMCELPRRWRLISCPF